MELENAVEVTKAAREENHADQENEGLEPINSWCAHLCASVHWKEGVVKTLLTKTSLAYAFKIFIKLNKGGTLI